ncbi:low specificity L-threonine aldolase [Pacificimonas flava]|uniref:Low specificity L-threonine aldolase n=2 Tax=Pacificimonas TaxID=1960290 RepID=A0A219B514_9SPHN|nr:MULTISPECIES: beta-eliminating lyase-related protein [Pacificimonas]MBZ6379324.1 low specificity L-threonine aldolase [Pacificimonas aurantium]OWV33472.1 low specificity L-threonine aldolase [Pacificimonas flava]
MHFFSDNNASACPEALEALVSANGVTRGSYDGDELSARLDRVFGDFFGHDCRVFPVSTGTAANALALAAFIPPWGAVVCHEEAHIQVDEAGAPEFYTGGAKLILAEGEGAILTPETVEDSVAALRGDVHQVQAGALSLTQASEYGRVYSPDQVSALADFARGRGWKVHMDGARLANALVHLDCHPGDVTWRAGVDVLSFGFIKNGGISAEALVFFDTDLASTIPHRRKRAGQMPSKGRFAAAQLLAMIESGAWKRNAEAANAGARQLAAALGDRLMHPVEANEIFVRIGTGNAAKLRAQGFDFYDWGDAGSGEARLVVAWDTPPGDIQALARAIAALED